MMTARTPGYAGFFPVEPEARGAKFVAALRVNLLTCSREACMA